MAEEAKPIKFLKPVFEAGEDKKANPWVVILILLILIALVSVFISPQGLSTSYSFGRYTATIMQILGILVVIYVAILFVGVIGVPAKTAAKIAEETITPAGAPAPAPPKAPEKSAKESIDEFAKKFERKPLEITKEIVAYADKTELEEGEETDIYAIPFENDERTDATVRFEIIGTGVFPDSRSKTKKTMSVKTEESVAIAHFRMGKGKQTLIKVMAEGYPIKEIVLTSAEEKPPSKKVEAAQDRSVQLKMIARAQIEDAVRRIDSLSTHLANTVRNLVGKGGRR